MQKGQNLNLTYKAKKTIFSNCKVVKTKNSSILKYLESSKNLGIKSIYFSEIKGGYVKGWNLHKKTKCKLSVIFGRIKFTVFNKNKKTLKTYILSRANFSLLEIPKNNWFKYESLNYPFSILVNSISIKHSKKEILKKDFNKYRFPE